MAIDHKFLNCNWNNGFQTLNSILLNQQYDPEVIFIGTFNHGWNWNNADLFYGRDMYMWTIMGNLFLHNGNVLINRRTAVNNIPTLNQIFGICRKGKISFADIVKGTKPNIPVPQAGNAIFVNNVYTWNTYKDDQIDYMGNQGWLDTNVQSIVNFISNTPSIKHVYFTFKSGNWLVIQMNNIISQILAIRPNLKVGSIFTPTGSGFRQNLPAFPMRAWSLAHCWIWNNLPNPVAVNKSGYTNLDHGWLINNGVNPKLDEPEPKRKKSVIFQQILVCGTSDLPLCV